ncbi:MULTISPECIES: SDR family NAD(P)-dependent oxidoreductase [unclassified Rhizobium]|uniref:SDR family NAD(P)-dependent oxidoreductase n=1 Tax=unclassified Rhizobium TaxID=2613769 RepID=UPI001ADAC985|nr:MULTISPECIES: SDR family NAD(P)-dependent oxidoreductase [unclassified Rhizobium]MBO9097938.1 SDR family NAD(P)-dependent oxidoreductase [Rhizobium sp. L58/93]MBO9133279.1 SDR family NAD(P)-dependent oxidoreductase [Rhizobium sp. B209b/85]MBO9168089.1 SDR family NAD(P)-dependent oxidoreductase [Rhizobium sp. L245/93]MBO9184134.1 SDR family NAD(P)-dependent oxidoreductase [Rhizobium sp. E27B/91]QXZ84344.1 SDR family NAD(P)-dependent oxidoreductase [Rhizobium sp. K1/93]
MSVNLQDKIALVTGASRGIGYFTALELAKAGAHVIACARTVGGLEELDDAIKAVGGRSTLVPFDLADMDAIDRLGGSIFERWGKLDILVANAGVLGTISPIGHVEAKVFEKVMTINVTATWRLIRSVEPLLMRSEAGRAVILSSSAAHKCRAFWGPYSASKAAVEALARTWAGETHGTPLRITSLDPGATRTAMRALAMPGEDPETVQHPRDVAEVIMGLVGPDVTETGKLFVVRENRLVDYRLPE